VSQSVLDIMKTHRFARQVEQNELSEFETWPLVEALGRLEARRTGHVDVGRLSDGVCMAGPRDGPASRPRPSCARNCTGLIGSTAKPLDSAARRRALRLRPHRPPDGAAC
jgi:glyceraldehyde 3-phosphate dehydrogenase